MNQEFFYQRITQLLTEGTSEAQVAKAAYQMLPTPKNNNEAMAAAVLAATLGQCWNVMQEVKTLQRLENLPRSAWSSRLDAIKALMEEAMADMHAAGDMYLSALMATQFVQETVHRN